MADDRDEAFASAVAPSEPPEGETPDALVTRAERLLVGVGAPRSPREAMALLKQAASIGSPAALLRLATLAATGPDIRRTLPQALRFLVAAAERGSVSAQDQLRVLAVPNRSLPDAGRGSWTRLAESVDAGAWLSRPDIVNHRARPRIRSLPAFLPARICEWMIRKASKDLTPALVQVGYHNSPSLDSTRTGSFFKLDILNADVIFGLVRARIGTALSMSVHTFEGPQILHYAPGQEFRPHYDFLNRNGPAGADGYQGDRAATFLIYLNDGYEGGHTVFPRAGFEYRGGAGDALCFANLDASGKPEPASLHAGLPPTAGEKWLLSQWIHDRPYIVT